MWRRIWSELLPAFARYIPYEAIVWGRGEATAVSRPANVVGEVESGQLVMSEHQGLSPGWYYASGDPEGTRRYWDGNSWVGEPQVWAAPAGTVPAAGAVDQPGSLGLASPGQRIGASLLDGLIQFVIFGIPALIFLIAAFDNQSLAGFEVDPGGAEPDLQDFGISRANELIITFVPTLIAFVWQFLWDALKGGTPGKLIVGIRIVNEGKTGPPGFATSFKRNLVYLSGLIPVVGGLVTAILWFISFIFLFTDAKRQTIMDKFAGTVVVEKQLAEQQYAEQQY